MIGRHSAVAARRLAHLAPTFCLSDMPTPPESFASLLASRRRFDWWQALVRVLSSIEAVRDGRALYVLLASAAPTVVATAVAAMVAAASAAVAVKAAVAATAVAVAKVAAVATAVAVATAAVATAAAATDSR